MRVLAIDHGSVRCGCALSDPTGTIVRPLEPISPPDPAAVARLAAEHSVARVLVGLPVSLAGGEGEQAAAARAFARQLEALVDVPVETYDERLSSVSANRALTEAGVRGRRRTKARQAGAVDQAAATVVLQSWLDGRR